MDDTSEPWLKSKLKLPLLVALSVLPAAVTATISNSAIASAFGAGIRTNVVQSDDADFLPPLFQKSRSKRIRKNGSIIRMMLVPQQLGTFETLSDFIRPEEQLERRVLLEDWYSEYSASPHSTDSTAITTTSTAGEGGVCIPYRRAWDEQRLRLQYHIDRLTYNDNNGVDNKRSSTLGPFLTKEQQQQIQQREFDPSLSLLTSSSPPSQPEQQQPLFDPMIALADMEANGDAGGGGEVAHAAGVDRIIMLQHAPVYTLGTGSDAANILDDKKGASEETVEVVRMDRGGEVTYHGPGQWTVYPILDLRHYKQDMHWYMRALEEVVIRACALCDGVNAVAYRDPDVTGVWMEGHKIAAVGVKARRWVTQHGVAINVHPSSLPNFEGIVPCGLTGRRVGCLQQFYHDASDPSSELSMEQFGKAIEAALEEVFCIQLVRPCALKNLKK